MCVLEYSDRYLCCIWHIVCAHRSDRYFWHSALNQILSYTYCFQNIFMLLVKKKLYQYYFTFTENCCFPTKMAILCKSINGS